MPAHSEIPFELILAERTVEFVLAYDIEIIALKNEIGSILRIIPWMVLGRCKN